MRVSQFLVIVPVLAQALLGIAVAGLHFYREWRSAAGDRLSALYRAQFELPVLFYAGSLFAYAMRIVDERVLFFAMLFVLAQLAGCLAGLLFESDNAAAAASLLSVLAAAGLWAMIGLHFFNSGF
ncbi:MAG: hypothetical protein KJ622_09335 [Alphaproteobacteria bacterium]|nr:hypothetical protein [Alphaproteobacteria bacterium]